MQTQKTTVKNPSLFIRKSELPAPAPFYGKANKVALPTMEGIHFERIKNIVSLEADGNYTRLHLEDGRKMLVCKTLRDMEQSLQGEAFVRVHRSYTINLRMIAKYVKGKGGYVVMDNGSTINVSTGRKKAFMEALASYF